MTTTSESDRQSQERFEEYQREWQEEQRALDAMKARLEAGIEVHDELDEMTPAQRRERIAQLAEQHEIAEDPSRAERARLEIAALREEELFTTQLTDTSFDTLPRAVRKLYRQNPSNPKFRALYDSVMQELYERADDTMRGALLPAVDKMVDLIDCGDEKVELRAATYVFERLRGRTPDVVTVTQDKPFQVMLERVVSGPRSIAAARTGAEREDVPIDAEIVAERLSAAPSLYEEEERLVSRWDDLDYTQD